MQDYSEKRNYPRMEIDCPASFKLTGQKAGGAIVKNLSGGGVLMWIEQTITPGEEIMIDITPVSDVTPPMTAELKVLRCTPVDGASGSFAVACQIQRVLG